VENTIITVKIKREVDGISQTQEASASIDDNMISHSAVSRMEYIKETVRSLVDGLKKEISE